LTLYVAYNSSIGILGFVAFRVLANRANFFPYLMDYNILQEIEQTKAFLEDMREMVLDQDKYQTLVFKLERRGVVVMEAWKRMAKEDWEKYYGLFGVDIYNHLHPQGNIEFLSN
jgi:hypothetical protein